MNEKKNKNSSGDPEEENLTYASDTFFKHPLTKIVIGTCLLFGAIYVSKYFLSASADMIKAFKKFRKAVKD